MNTFAREDHSHGTVPFVTSGVATTVVSGVTYDQPVVVGTQLDFARADHSHGTVPTRTSGAATTVVTEQTLGQASAVGTSLLFARADHTHGTPTIALAQIPNLYSKFEHTCWSGVLPWYFQEVGAPGMTVYNSTGDTWYTSRTAGWRAGYVKAQGVRTSIIRAAATDWVGDDYFIIEESVGIAAGWRIYRDATCGAGQIKFYSCNGAYETTTVTPTVAIATLQYFKVTVENGTTKFYTDNGAGGFTLSATHTVHPIPYASFVVGAFYIPGNNAILTLSQYNIYYNQVI
jgi:hypothetical protein